MFLVCQLCKAVKNRWEDFGVDEGELQCKQSIQCRENSLKFRRWVERERESQSSSRENFPVRHENTRDFPTLRKRLEGKFCRRNVLLFLLTNLASSAQLSYILASFCLHKSSLTWVPRLWEGKKNYRENWESEREKFFLHECCNFCVSQKGTSDQEKKQLQVLLGWDGKVFLN